MKQIKLSLEETPNRDDIELLGKRLAEYNAAQIGFEDGKRLVLLLRNERGEMVGGLSGWTFWGWLAVDLLWIHESLRGKGYGARLLQTAEQEAIARGCRQVLLDTFSFQAPEFYRKHGYEIYAVLDFIGPHKRYYLKKSLG